MTSLYKLKMYTLLKKNYQTHISQQIYRGRKTL